MWSQIGVLSEDEVFNDTFSVNTLVRIDNSDPYSIDHDPRLRATFRNDHVVVAIDKILHLLEKDLIYGQSQNTKVIAFPCDIDCLTISSDGSLIFCGLSDGSIVGLALASMDKGPLFNTIINKQHVDESFNAPRRTFVDVIEYNSTYFFCCTNGVIYKLYGIDSTMVKQEPSADCNETISNNVMLEVVNAKRTNVIVSSYTITFYEGQPMHIYCGEDYVFMKSHGIEHRFKLHGVKQLQSDYIMTFALTASGSMYELCPYTGLANPIDLPEKVLDYIITATNDDGIEILALTEDKSKSTFLKVFDYSNMNCKCSLPVSNQVWLIEQPKSSASIFYFGGNRSSASKYVENIHLNMVSESQPEKRLHTLLTKGMLVEAEELAKKFKLDPQPIYEVKAKRILQEMGTINQNDVKAIQKRLDDLIGVAKKIKNTEFLLQLRNLEMPDRKVLKKLLEFLTEVIKFDNHPKIGEEIKEQLLRLNTLQLIDPNECMMQWQKFVQHQNLGNYCLKYMETNISAACLILKQHACCIIPHLRQDTAVKMLREIPKETEPFGIIQWMRHYFPLVAEEFPETMPKIVDWVIAKTVLYERSNDWPAIGIEFGKKMLDICKSVKFTFSDQRRHYDLSLTKLNKVIDSMEELLVLKNQYNLHVNFEEYFDSSIEDCAFNLLQRINIKNLPDLVNKFLFVVFTEKGAKLQNTLTRYIDHLTQYRSALRMWLPRAVACLKLITNQEVKLRYALTIAKLAPVPWPEEMNPIIELRASSHAFAKEIDNEYKMQQVKMLRTKYGCRADSSGNPTKFVLRMVSQNRDELLSDLEIFKKFSSEINPETNFYCVYHLSRDGHIQKALQYLKTLSEDEARVCYIKVANITPSMISDYMNKPEIYENLMELLRFVMDKEIGDENKEKITDLMNLQLLKKSALNMSVTLDDLTNESKVKQYLDTGIDQLLQILRTKEKHLADVIWHNVKVLSAALKVNKFEIIFKMANTINNVKFTTLLAKLFRDEVAGTNENYIEMAVTLITQQYNASSSEAVCPDESDSYAYPMANFYAQKVEGIEMVNVQQLIHFTKIGLNAFELTQFQQFLDGNVDEDDEIIQDALESLNRLESTTTTRRRDSMSIFEEVNHVNPIPVIEHKSAAVIKTLSLTLQAIVCELQPTTPFYDYFKEAVTPDEPFDRNKFLSSLEQLIKMKLYTTAFSIIHCVRTQQKFTTKKLLGVSLEDMYFHKILKSALHQKEPQFHLLVPILRSHSDSERALRMLTDELKSGLSKMNCLQLTEKYCQLTGDAKEARAAKEAHLKYKYYMQLRQLDPSIKDDFQISFPELFTAMNQKMFDIQLLERMSKDFEWNFQKVLVTQISTILSVQELEFDTQTNELGEEIIAVHTSPEKLRALCEPYLTQVTDMKLLGSNLYEIINNINPYFYELFLCVLNILSEIRELRVEVQQWSHILLFLKHKMVKKRERRVAQFETDWWIRKQGESTIMPKISKYRLPFLMVVTESLQDFLGDVVTIEDTVEWFPLIKFHSHMHGIVNGIEIDQEKDTLCMTVFKKVLSERQSSIKEHSQWCLQPVNNAFLQSVMHVVNHMKDIHRILLVLYMVFSNAPEGADQLEAAYQCYKFVKQNQAALNELQRSKDLAFKIKGKYSVLKVQHQLHLYGLYDDDLSDLIANPQELIKALYNRTNLNNTDSKCDVNKVAEEFAKLFGLKFHDIQMSLLKQWLAVGATNENNPLEQTLYDDELNSTVTPAKDEDENANLSVEKAYYILKSWDPVNASQFIINNIFTGHEESMNTSRQLQLFECLIKLANKDMNPSFLEFVEESKYIALKCVHHLKPFGYMLSIEKFQSYDKIKILKQLWSSHATNPKALSVITYICLGYDIYEPKIWNNVLRQMVALHMADELNSIINKISVKPEIVHSDGIVTALNYLIRLPFKNMGKMRTDEQDEALTKALFILQSCPVKHKLNFVDLVETCIAMKQFHFGAVILALSRDELKPQIKKLLMPYRHEALKEEIINLEEYDIFPFVTVQAVKMLELL